MKCGEPFGSNLRIEDHHWYVCFIGPRIRVITFVQIRFWPGGKKDTLKNMYAISTLIKSITQPVIARAAICNESSRTERKPLPQGVTCLQLPSGAS